MKYGERRDYKKINMFVKRGGIWYYGASTTWSPTCRDAKEKYAEAYNVSVKDIKARFAK